ncbi:hypothetical protein PTTG_30083 [Puccinia triticina 1-1 BBBD Race 1]|uniref:Uncharacterized protein n=1 Tax=Puccinia triticina (isolate 1-1 / race 1 (BBBD)) TaxID=630390 RepID=A0A180G0Y0_PUCT1|nr:hypothetical protein PTTG_30083 [Puccinia triticina 1-1 BBBD Race 1]
MRATAAELREDNQQNLDEGGNVEPASAVLAPEIGNPANEQVCPPELLTWAPYAGIAHFPDGMIREDNHTIDGAGSQFSEEISDSDYVPSEARSVLLSELDSDNEANGEGWEMNPGDLRAMVEAVMPSVQGTRPQLPPTQKHRQTDKSWWPFRSKEHSIASLVIGYTHSIVSRSLYNHLKLMFRLFGIKLPDWTTIRRAKADMRALLKMDVQYSKSIFNTPTYALSLKQILAQEIANPLVSPVLEFYPQDARGKDIYKLSQSWKWLEGLDSSSLGGEMWSKCVPLEFNPEVNGPHLRLTIPGHTSFTSAHVLTIPVGDFFRDYKGIRGPEGLLLSGRCNGKLYELGNNITLIHCLPNPWRERAKGKIIRHMPITLYCDDTSGNQSKRWNKHISFFFTLSGLPPEMTNQQYNCHYLTTSNVAGAMELAVPIVADLRHLATEGVVGWDCSIMQEVLITSTLLCFLGDSPMHAEITSTPIPGNCLHPCRACDLSAENMKGKATIEYVCSFCMLGLSGEWISNPIRSWATIKENCYKIWHTSHEPRSKTAVENLHTQLGVKDTLNKTIIDRKYEIITKDKKKEATRAELKFLLDHGKLDSKRQKTIFNSFFELDAGFDGCLDTPVEVLHVFLLGVVKYLVRAFMKALAPAQIPKVTARYQSFDTNALNIPSLQPRYLTRHYSNFIGKDFKIVLQTAPFVLFEYMSEHERLLWSALCQLAPLIFETRIKDMETYLSELTLRIRLFVCLLIKGTAQWVNKPKFHMLLHLPDAIRRFGPPALFATEKLESYNGILRNASIHSNRQSPSKDIGVTFANFRNLRLLYSGGYFWVEERKTYETAATSVINLFKSNDSVQKSMGYNTSLFANSCDSYPRVRDRKLTAAQRFAVPPALASHLPGSSWRQLAEISLTSKDVLRVSSFILYQSKGGTGRPDVGRVDMLWEAEKPTGSFLFVCLTPFEFGGISEFYNMREIFQAGEGQFISVQNIVAVINVQHDCHKSKCSVTLSKKVRVERQDTENLVGELTHANKTSYIVNVAALSSPLAHREFSEIHLQRVEPLAQIRCLHEGITQWHLAGTKTGSPMPMEVVDPSLV